MSPFSRMLLILEHPQLPQKPFTVINWANFSQIDFIWDLLNVC